MILKYTYGAVAPSSVLPKNTKQYLGHHVSHFKKTSDKKSNELYLPVILPVLSLGTPMFDSSFFHSSTNSLPVVICFAPRHACTCARACRISRNPDVRNTCVAKKKVVIGIYPCGSLCVGQRCSLRVLFCSIFAYSVTIFAIDKFVSDS